MMKLHAVNCASYRVGGSQPVTLRATLRVVFVVSCCVWVGAGAVVVVVVGEEGGGLCVRVCARLCECVCRVEVNWKQRVRQSVGDGFNNRSRLQHGTCVCVCYCNDGQLLVAPLYSVIKVGPPSVCPSVRPAPSLRLWWASPTRELQDTKCPERSDLTAVSIATPPCV